jgi:hypothetical protein
MDDKLLNRANFLSNKISRIQNTLDRIEEYKSKNNYSLSPYKYFSIDMEMLEPVLDIIIDSLKDERRTCSIELSNL